MSEQLFIGRYKILEEIGRGAMSVVYHAQDPEIERSLAIKLLKHDLVEQEEFRQLFLSEAKSAGRLSHPGIVTIYDMGIWHNRPFIAMELIKGQTLEEYLSVNPQMELEQIIEFAKQVSQALDYAHSNGIVHQDLKPDNIMVLDNGKRFKIADFGIAKIENQFAEGSLLNEMGDKSSKENEEPRKTMGTPAYMSPEQITGHGIDFKTDLYSFGVILYQLTKGEMPYKANNYAAMMQAVLQKNPEPLHVDSESGLLWQSIVFRLLQKNPDLRYENANSLLQELTSLEQELAQNQKGIASIRFVSMRARWAIMISAAVLFVMVFGMIWVYKEQNELMSELMYDYGNSISQIIAQETAEQLILDESLTLQAVTNDIAQNSQIIALSIRDNSDIVKSSNDLKTVGKTFKLVADSKLAKDYSRYKVYSNESSYDNPVFIFDTPINYQSKQIGWVTVALSRSNLQSATGNSLLTMVVWMFLILLVVFTGIYWQANKFTKRLNLSRNTLRLIRNNGQHDPIDIKMHDELGRLQQEINQLSVQVSGLTQTQKLTQINLDSKALDALNSTETELNKTIVISHQDDG